MLRLVYWNTTSRPSDIQKRYSETRTIYRTPHHSASAMSRIKSLEAAEAYGKV
jgi:hypothetical protein